MQHPHTKLTIRDRDAVPFTEWLETVGPVTCFEDLYRKYLLALDCRARPSASRMRLVERLRVVGVRVAEDGSIVLPEDWQTTTHGGHR